jgi:predicted GIY-YIG superfamily endonuclease
MKKRDTYRYILKNGNSIEYIGISNNPERREAEHSKDKLFSKMEIVGPIVSRESAEKWESERIRTYRQNHNGKIPPANKTKNGK